jgi:hypothetical protein
MEGDMMNKEELIKLTAVCGIDCFNCEFFHTNIDGFFQSMTAEKKAVFDARGMTVEKLRCKGCKITGCTMIQGKCDTLECARKKNVEFCYECDEFPCSKLQPLADYAATAPHNLKVYNLVSIQKQGIEAWATNTMKIRRGYYLGKFKIGAGPQVKEE